MQIPAMRAATTCSILLAAAAVAAVSCGGGGRNVADADSIPTDTITPYEQARSLTAAYASLAEEYDSLCCMRREALAEQNDALHREQMARTDSLIEVLSARSRALDAEWRHIATKYYDRCDGSFTEFCRGAEVDSASIDVEACKIYESLNH